jgi:hypothetical protein
LFSFIRTNFARFSIEKSYSLQDIIEKWIRDRRFPLVAELSLNNWRMIASGSGKRVAIAIVDPSQKDFAS